MDTQGHANGQTLASAWAVSAILLLFTSALAGGCADTSSTQYPDLGTMNEMGKTLTPEERQKAIADVQKSKDKQNRDAPK